MRESAGPRSAQWWRDGRVWSWAVLVFVLVLVASVRFRLREMPLERDEGEYAYAGQLLLEGITPWKLVYSMKFPGTAAGYAVLMTIFGQDCAGVHLGLLVVNAASIILVFLLTLRMVGMPASAVAAAGYGLMSLSGEALGLAGHATHFVVLFALSGFVLLWRATETLSPAALFGSGCLLGLAVIMKQNGAFFAALGVIWTGWISCTRQKVAMRPCLKTNGAFLAGLATPLLLMLMWLWRAGVLEKFWYWTFEYARNYGIKNPGLEEVLRRLTQRMPVSEQPAFYAALAGLAALWSRRVQWSAALFASGLFFCSLAAVVPGFHFRPHYFVLLMPILALLTGAAVQEAGRLLNRPKLKLLAAAPMVAFAIMFAKGVAKERELFFAMTPIAACRSLYGYQPFPEAQTIADYIRAHSPADARIAVLGSEPEIYFYAHRRSGTGYIYTYPLMERQPFARQMRAEMKEEIRTADPQFVVQVRTWTSWLARPGSAALIAERCGELMPPGYKLTGSAEVFAADARVDWRWGEEAGALTNASISLLIFEREGRAIP